MSGCKSVYEPQEDSSLLERHVRQYAKGKVLDVGTGSGVQAIAAAQGKNVSTVFATDVQKGVIEYCKKNIKNKKIRFLHSDLFEIFKKNKNFRNSKFDTIIFNPPYLPQELRLRDLTVEGGKKGYEVIEKFLSEVNGFLSPDGIILLTFSSLTKKEKVEEFTRNYLLDFQELERVHIFFEDIYVYLLRKNEFLRKLEGRGMTNVEYLAKGRRGLLFTAAYKNKKVAIKTKNPDSTAVNRVESEPKWLERLNSKRVGPKLLFFDDGYFVYEYIDGDLILDYLQKSDKEKIKKIIREIFNQMLVLDNLKIDKEEMHHPLKHVIISNHNAFLIDFERAHFSLNPKNVTQFCQFLMSGHMETILKSRNISINREKMMELAKIYKNRQSNANFKNLLGLI